MCCFSKLIYYFSYHLIIIHLEGVDFFGPEPPVLTFVSGQSTGDTQCASVAILDDSFLESERNFSIRLETIATERAVQTAASMLLVDIDIEVDSEDSKYSMNCIRVSSSSVFPSNSIWIDIGPIW